MKDAVILMTVKSVLGLLIAEALMTAIGEVTGKFEHHTPVWMATVLASVVTTIIYSTFKKKS